MSRPTKLLAALATLLASSFAAPTAVAQASSSSWSEVKCARYKEAWLEGLARRGRRGLGREFLGRHEAFLASGCRCLPHTRHGERQAQHSNRSRYGEHGNGVLYTRH